MVIAHEQPGQFQRLIRALRSRNVHFFVHIDMKSDISEFINCASLEDITFIDRISVNHGGFTQAQTMIKLLEAASKENKFDYFIFLSGRDYPIKNNHYIYTFLEHHYPMNFINFYPLVGKAYLVRHLDRYYFIDFIGYYPNLLQKMLRAVQLGLHMLLPKRRFIDGVTPYRGSNWSCLSKPSVDYVIHFLSLREAQDYIKFFKYTFGSDEMFFQSILLNSDYAKQCHLYDPDVINGKVFMQNENKAYLHYIDWNRNRECPAILDLTDFQMLKDSKFLFARKMCQDKSGQLLDRIDRCLLGLS